MRDFNHTVNVLVKAYLEGTLEHGNCFACAVGNIIAESTGRKLVRESGCSGRIIWKGDKYPHGNNGWGGVVTSGMLDRTIKIDWTMYFGEPKIQIDSTGYSVEEIAKIEWAFERAEYGNSEDDWMFNGLMQVVNVLAEIHNVDLSVRESAKAMFVKETTQP